VKSLPGFADPSSTCTNVIMIIFLISSTFINMTAEAQSVEERAPPAYLDGDVRRVGALPAALDLYLKHLRGLTGSVAGRRQLHPGPGQLQSAGEFFIY